MNIEDTRNFLTMLWSLFPNAPKSSPDEKRATVAAWFCVLHEYTISDAWNAAQEVLREKPTFIPTAFEILNRCRKTVNPEDFVCSEYKDLESKYIGSTKIYQNRNNYDYELSCLYRELDGETDDEKIAVLNTRIRQNIDQRFIERRLLELYHEAHITAEAMYDQREKARYSADFKSLGFGICSENQQCIR